MVGVLLYYCIACFRAFILLYCISQALEQQKKKNYKID